jgi:DNA mismatch repair protein MutL
MATVYRAVREAWRSEEFPALFLFVDLPAAAVDVNVHPQKSEVRFRDPAIFDRIEAALLTALSEALGEGRAPLRMPLAEPSVPFVWQGMGRRNFANFEVREGSHGVTDGGELADVVYAPLPRRSVPLSGRSGEPRRFHILGQYKGSLILLEGPEGLLLIDQHAAHERILYERLRRASREDRIASQDFVAPVILELGASESLQLGEVQPQLEACGFSLTELSPTSWALRSAPANLTPDEAEGVVLALSTDTELRDGSVDIRERLLHALSASQSCRSAIKIHHPLTPAEMETLVEELFAAEQPYTCPHGRPVVLEMSDADLERRFGRR